MLLLRKVTGEILKFDELEVNSKLMRGITDMGFEEATPIQERAIPAMLAGKDIVGQAQTGTGKTAAFAIPLLEKIDTSIKKPQAIILCPTRELAIQVAEEVRKLSKYMHDVKILPVYGGQDITKQIRSLKAGVQVIIGTPGRVMDHMRRKTVKFSEIHTVVLDEADEMLNMGFREDIETILADTPEGRQTVLFSATMPQPIMDIARRFQKNSEIIRMVKKDLTVKNIEQYYFEVRPGNKDEVLSRLIDIYNPKLSVIFCNTKKKVDELTADLQGRGYFAEGLHGDLKQQQRDRVMESFRKGKTEILVATDVAARGIDVDNIDIVFNYDLPQDDEYYVHRIGRTGRAGKTGLAFTFIRGKEVYKLKDIERYCKTKIVAKPVPSLNDVTQTRTDNLFHEIGQVIAEEDLTSMIAMLEKKINDEDYTAMDVAAAFLKMHLNTKEIDTEQQQNADFGDTGAENGMVRLFINIGKSQKVTPGNILGAIAGESGIPGKLVGSINMFDQYTFVEVPVDVAGNVMNAMKNVKIKGKKINIEPANRK
ncbi:MAG: DEAD/DEAH box helicase [Lachnospiraceae bacterium]